MTLMIGGTCLSTDSASIFITMMTAQLWITFTTSKEIELIFVIDALSDACFLYVGVWKFEARWRIGKRFPPSLG